MRETDPVTFDLARIGAGLPFAASLPELRQALAQADAAAVVQAPPGTGKTTLVPPQLAELVNQSGCGGRVVVTAPRRIAVRAAAGRLAELDRGPVGERVGFTIRGQRRVGRATSVEFVTPGVLLRRLLADPELPGVAAVVLDEVHERGLETDLLVGMLAQVRQLRADLRLVAMSATLDAPRFAQLLGDPEPVPIIDCPAHLHPLQVRWRPAQGPRFDARGVSRDFLQHVVAVTCSAAREHSASDALVLLPGAWEVAGVAHALRDALPDSEVLQLHGRLAPRDQDRVLRGRGPERPRRVVVSTALAESSLTVPGVRVVIDAGLSREPRRDSARGMSGLVTVAASRDAATQRAGRAARLGPGMAVRCYDEQTYARMPAHVTPQIASADLDEAALLLACWGAAGGQGLPLPDPPPPAALADAHAVLRGLGAIDADGRVTDEGRALAALPLDPRLGRALRAGAAVAGVRAAAEVVATLSEDHRPDGADLPSLIARLRCGRAPGAEAWEAQRRRLERLAAAVTTQPAAAVGRQPPAASTGSALTQPPGAAGLVIAQAYPERVARRDGATYLLASGTRAALPPGSSLHGEPWLAVAQVGRVEGAASAGTGALIRAAAVITREQALVAAAPLHARQDQATWRGGRVTARRVESLGAIELAATPVAPGGDLSRDAVLDALRTQGLSVLSWSPPARELRRRLAFLRHHLGDPWPTVSKAALVAAWQTWLGPEVEALGRGARADTIDLHDPLRRLLPWAGGHAARLDELAPVRLPVPSGRTAAVTYPPVGRDDEPPVVAVKLQECFGLAQTPRLADGRAPVLFHLLSPAGRPLALTDDLASFWSGPYQHVRAEMRGRYPRHPWPEDPWTAPATARATRRSPR